MDFHLNIQVDLLILKRSVGTQILDILKETWSGKRMLFGLKTVKFFPLAMNLTDLKKFSHAILTEYPA